MALDPSTEPCSLLNATGYPTLFLSSTAADTDAYPKIVDGGNLITYESILNTSGFDSTKAVLSTTAASSTSSLRLIQFLSGGGVAAGGAAEAPAAVVAGGAAAVAGGAAAEAERAAAATNYTQLRNVALYTVSGSTRTYESIISYFVAISGANSIPAYDPKNIASSATSLIPANRFWNASDAVDGAIIPAPSSVLGKLIRRGYLLSQLQIYNPGQLATSPSISVGQESLVYLYRLQQGTTPLTSAQATLKTTLEATNLRFFGAFMAEYCFYRTRYQWLLKQYFTIYTQKTAANGGSGSTLYTDLVTGTPAFQLFGGPNPRASTAALTQSEYLSGLAYQMAALNMRMADMKQLLAAINTYYNGVFVLIQNNVNSANVGGGNAALTETITALQASSDTANKYLSEQDFSKQVMEYNSEKNRYSNVLLGLYAFLNIAALASVFHLARS